MPYLVTNIADRFPRAYLKCMSDKDSFLTNVEAIQVDMLKHFSTHGPNLAYCSIFLNKRMQIFKDHSGHSCRTRLLYS